MKNIAIVFLSLIILFQAVPISPSASKLDEEIQEMANSGVITGYTNGSLGASDKVQRGQFATFLARALDLPEGPAKFSDVPSSTKLASGINAAAQAGFVSGSANGKFYPEAFITREQMALMIHRVLKKAGVSGGQATVPFTDISQVTASSSRTAINEMAYHSIILGIPNKDKNGNELGTYRFDPKADATRGQAAAFISRMLKAIPVTEPDPAVDPVPVQAYQVSTVTKNGPSTSAKSFGTYEEAEAAMTEEADQVIMFNGKIIKMNAGIVIAQPTEANAATLLYQENLKDHYFNVDAGAYGTPATEMEYVESDADKIKVKVAGVTGYVKHTDAYLLPEPMITNRAYYEADSGGNLWHRLYNIKKTKYETYTAGAAPDFMKPGVKYYSWDGETFFTENGEAGTAYQYFNLLSARSKTNYTAAEIDAYIVQELARREKLDPVKYKDATKRSKLLNIGASLKQVEKDYKINALLLLGITFNESDFGMSPNSLEYNNLFGLAVHDNSKDSSGRKFDSPYESLVSIVNEFFNKNYIAFPPSGVRRYHHGAQLGNKKNGINRRYASDPNWGKKAAGHMYEFDKKMGGKDFLQNPNPYVIGITNQWVRVRSSASTDTDSNILFQYPVDDGAGYSVVIVDTVKGTDGANWYKVLSDTNEQEFAYIHSDYIDIIQPVQ